MAEAVTKLAPLFNRILVKKANPITMTKTGLHLPEKPRSDFSKGTVLATGPGGLSRNGQVVPCCLKPGDEVILPDFGGTQVKLSGSDEEYFLYREPDILAKIDRS